MSSTTRKNGFRASCLCSKIETSTTCRPPRRRRRDSTRTPNTASGRRAVKVQQAFFEGKFAHNVSISGWPTLAWQRMQDMVSSDALGGIDIVHDVLMTFAAGIFRHAPAAFLDLDRVVKFAGGERERMKKAVLGFREIFRNEPGGVWQSLQVATERWLDFIQPSRWSCMTWQLAQALGSFPRYERALGVNEGVTRRVPPSLRGRARSRPRAGPSPWSVVLMNPLAASSS